MEHRSRRRAARRHLVMIYKNGEPVGVGKTKNISNQGLFVRSAYRAVLRQSLDIEFFEVENGQELRLKAYVVHQNSDGFGMEILDTAQRIWLTRYLLHMGTVDDSGFARSAVGRLRRMLDRLDRSHCEEKIYYALMGVRCGNQRSYFLRAFGLAFDGAGGSEKSSACAGPVRD